MRMSGGLTQLVGDLVMRTAFLPRRTNEYRPLCPCHDDATLSSVDDNTHATQTTSCTNAQARNPRHCVSPSSRMHVPCQKPDPARRHGRHACPCLRGERFEGVQKRNEMQRWEMGSWRLRTPQFSSWCQANGCRGFSPRVIGKGGWVAGYLVTRPVAGTQPSRDCSSKY